MQRLGFILIAVLAIGMSSADAAHHKKTKAAAHPADVQQVSRPMARPSIARPPWAAPQQCFTDDGYGRFLSCSTGDGR